MHESVVSLDVALLLLAFPRFDPPGVHSVFDLNRKPAAEHLKESSMEHHWNLGT